MLPATRQRWHPRLYPSRSWYSIERPRRDARLSWRRRERRIIVPQLKRISVQLPTSANNVTLVVFAVQCHTAVCNAAGRLVVATVNRYLMPNGPTEANPLQPNDGTVNIACPHGAQQQTRCTLLWQRETGQTDRQKDRHRTITQTLPYTMRAGPIMLDCQRPCWRVGYCRPGVSLSEKRGPVCSEDGAILGHSRPPPPTPCQRWLSARQSDVVSACNTRDPALMSRRHAGPRAARIVAISFRAWITWLLVRHVSFMRHLKKICRPHKHQIWGGILYKIAWNQLPHLVPHGSGTWMVQFCWQPDGRGNET